jgi:ATP-dependent helicase/nuclease subunit A
LILKACCSTTQGIYKVIGAYEKVYNANTRRRGMMTFSDIPELISGLDSSIRQNIEYRFDTRFQHWALDEFQDTSHSQWNAVKELVDEVIQSADEDRSIFIVGDVKQAIYGWRGGDVGIFNGEADSGMYKLQNLSISYRYSPEIADLVNLVFNGDHIARCLNASASGAGELWRRNWVAHESRQAPGYIAIERVEKAPKGKQGITSWIDRTCEILQESMPWKRGISTAILVRSNSQGAAFADALKTAGIPAVWEGENSICDTPVVNALLHVLLVAEHPGNTLAWQHICASPLAQSVFKKECSLSPEDGAAALSGRVLADISKRGLSRSLRGYVEGAISKGVDDFTESRLDDLIRAASAFSARPDPENGLTDFAAFAETFVNRDKAGASTVKILTVHRSKGLGFDYVILPVIESNGFTTMREDTALRDKNNRWILNTPPKLLREHDPVLADAWEHALNNSVFEQLCVKYVAMTRAKRAMTILLKPPAGKSTVTEYFSDYLEQSLPEPLPYTKGNPQWHTCYTSEAPIEQNEEYCIPAIKREKREDVSRVTPSRTVLEGMNAATLFSRSESGAMLKGTRIHEALSEIMWLEPPFIQPTGIGKSEVDLSAESPLRDALTRPEDAIDLWRERSFEIILNKRWVSGIFDRVVFRGTGKNVSAEIMDFKTNRMYKTESTDDFHSRITETYKSQMELYREALEHLSGIPAERITTSLLLTETREVVSCYSLNYCHKKRET